jgi:hypothetical protein
LLTIAIWPWLLCDYMCVSSVDSMGQFKQQYCAWSMFWYCCCDHPKLLQFTALRRRGETFTNVLIVWNLIMTCVNDNHILGRFQRPWNMGAMQIFWYVCINAVTCKVRSRILSAVVLPACWRWIVNIRLLYRVEEKNTVRGGKGGSKLRTLRCGTVSGNALVSCTLVVKVVTGVNIAT